MKSSGNLNIPLFIEGDGERRYRHRWSSTDVAEDVADPVLSLGKLIMKGYTSTFGMHENCMAKDGVRVKISPRGKMSTSRVRGQRKCNFYTTVVAPVDEGSAGTDVPADGSGPLRGRGSAAEGVCEIRQCSKRPSEALVRAHELAQCPYADWRQAPSVGVERERSRRKAQMDDAFMSRDGAMRTEPRVQGGDLHSSWSGWRCSCDDGVAQHVGRSWCTIRERVLGSFG